MIRSDSIHSGNFRLEDETVAILTPSTAVTGHIANMNQNEGQDLA